MNGGTRGEAGHEHSHGQGLWGRVKHAILPHGHDVNDEIQTAEESTRDGIRTAWIGLAGMMATAVAQVVIVWLSGSIALLADTIHNIGHAATTIPLILAFQLGRRAPTQRYPFGFRRAEDLVGLLISAVIAASIVLIVWESIDALVNPREMTHLGWVLTAGVVGFAGNEAVAVYRIRTGGRIGSAALIAEGQHARADGYTSLAVVVGAVGVLLGFERADAIAGLLIAVAITGVLINSLRIIVRRLMDGIDPATLETIRSAAASSPGVREVGPVRARWTGHRMEADAVVSVDAHLDVIGAHAIAGAVEQDMRAACRNLDHVSVHVHPATPPFVRAGGDQRAAGLLHQPVSVDAVSVDHPRPLRRTHPPTGALRALLIALAVALGGSLAAGAHGLPAAAAQPAHAHALQHSGHTGHHHHVGEELLQRSTSAQSQHRKVRTRRRKQAAGTRHHPIWRRTNLRAAPRPWTRLRPPPVTDVRLRICLIRV